MFFIIKAETGQMFLRLEILAGSENFNDKLVQKKVKITTNFKYVFVYHLVIVCKL